MDDREANNHLGEVVGHFIIVNVVLILCLFVSGNFAHEFIIGAILVLLYSGVNLIRLAASKTAWSARARKIYFFFLVLLAAEITLAFLIQK